MRVSIIKYGVGNVASVLNMFKKVGVQAELAETVEQISKAQALLLPGVGAFDYCMSQFNASGLRNSIEKRVFIDNVPILGICVGFQMLFASSAEGGAKGLGWLEGNVVRFNSAKLDPRQKIPHMGWSDVVPRAQHPLFSGLDAPRFYFVHSYHAEDVSDTYSIAHCRYGYEFCCGIQKESVMGVQFHPEKSHRYGMQLFRNFANNTSSSKSEIA